MVRFLKATLVGGVFVLLPVAGCVFLLATVVNAVLGIIQPVASLLPVQRLGGVAVVNLLVIGLVLSVCFALGLLVYTTLGRAVGTWLENTALRLLPGYGLMRRLAQQMSGGGKETLGAPVLVRLGGVRQFAFLVEQHDTGDVLVYVPLVPSLALGSVYIVGREDVQALNVPVTSVLNCLGQYGVDALELLAKKSEPASS